MNILGKRLLFIVLLVAILSNCLKYNFVFAEDLIVTAQVGGQNNNGGGGGGGGGYNVPTSVTFSGFAYPFSHVTLLKDGIVVVTTIAGGDANFSISLTNLFSGSYVFTLYAEDNKNVKSTLVNFSLYITQNTSTTVSGIFIAPSIMVDKDQVKKGDNITIFGQSRPDSNITISVHSNPEYFKSTSSNSQGMYLYNFDTSFLDFGQHETKSKALSNNLISQFGHIATFGVTDGVTVLNTEMSCNNKSDINSDCKINIVDFSIMSFWYKKISPPAKVDLNNDGAVSIIDFSIMAYNWTG